MRSNSLQLEVKNQGSSSAIHSSDKLSEKKAFIRVTADKTNVYYGEKVTLTYKVYFREVDMNLTPKFPPFRGFWAQDLPADQKSLENVNGVTFQTQVLRKVELFPQKSGALTIDPVTIEALIRKQGRPMDIFDRFFQDPFGDLEIHDYEQKLMQSNSLQINVKPLPEPKPLFFSDAVGKFDLKVSVDKEIVNANEPVKLIMTINGNGNLPMVQPPVITIDSTMELFEPKVTDKQDIKSFEYTIIPGRQGSYKIPAIQFAYFDPVKKDYVILSSQQIALQVAPALPQPEEEDATPAQTHSHNYFKHFIWIVAASIVAWLLLRYRHKLLPARKEKTTIAPPHNLDSDPDAFKKATENLNVAHAYINKADEKLFFEKISRALKTYLQQKFNMTGAYNSVRLQPLLTSKGISTHTQQQLFNIFKTCEAALYASRSSPASREHIYQQAVEVVLEMENR